MDDSHRLHHLTLNTGDMTTPLLTSADPVALGITDGWMRQVAASPGLALPVPGYGDAGYSAQTLSAGDTLMQTVIGPDSAPLVTFGVAPSACPDADALWALLARYSRTAYPPPAYPWCAVLVHPSIALHTSCLAWIGDYERCVAVAWVNICNSR